ncbi:hypothetical protein FVEN_g12756 [Fusarium venenatum]|uniref:Uncharacterized protein n=1 Tax=Fusarium venenatum TaxID=56646 RepID=A0A2L2TDY6_9HYPO|nr:uncharacterized protein FVRRES_09269 [Fusarium venenatum]KAG8358217.1 hypothetical protein FVEN_g12756 [Fusarium venenatum]CEI69192.1 unnamed protein product [Fusarium venenatum]
MGWARSRSKVHIFRPGFDENLYSHETTISPSHIEHATPEQKLAEAYNFDTQVPVAIQKPLRAETVAVFDAGL